MAVFRIVTFLIHAITLAFASLLTAVFTHLLPALAVMAVLVAVTLALLSGAGGVALLRRKRAADRRPE